jgi:wyosine [tRNA(Phe)-imidazoG37] synthetase (radical SAM superfamily)
MIEHTPEVEKTVRRELDDLDKQMLHLKMINKKQYNKFKKASVGKFSDTILKRLK